MPSKNWRTACTNTNGATEPVWPPAPALTRIKPSAPAWAALRAMAMLPTSANTRPP